ncbi:rhodanese-like domain-containing protein [Bizionia sediminis]|uniref:Rhodanese-like domain-containing protein n=1 Tax=Bizionia sediminis TaxID=1737064 RepID=A0ABW5KVP7_9FLAO
MGILDFIFGVKKRQIKAFLNQDAVILDVRTKREWESGHIPGAMHIPLNTLPNRIETIKKLNKPVIVCCASGARSSKAAKYLNLQHINAINGGGWQQLLKQHAN